MSKVQIKVEPVGKFFERARELARRADAGKRMPGHGRQKWIRAASAAIDLVARV